MSDARGRAPTGTEWSEARRQALRTLRRRYPDVAHEADLIVDDSILESLPRFVGGSFAALVTATTTRRALDRLREMGVARRSYDVMREEEVARFEATAADSDGETAERPVTSITLDATRAATLAECRARLARAVGDDGAALYETACRARQVLRLAAEAPALSRVVNVTALRTLAGDETEHPGGWPLCRYTDASGVERHYGTTHAEAAVLAILAGYWPLMKLGALPRDVIAAKASAIQMSAIRSARRAS